MVIRHTPGRADRARRARRAHRTPTGGRRSAVGGRRDHGGGRGSGAGTVEAERRCRETEKEGGEGTVETPVGGRAEAVADDGAEHRAENPERVEQETRAEEDLAPEGAASACEGPRL